MSDSAQNANVSDIWSSLPGQTASSSTVIPVQPGGKLGEAGKPAGEGGGGWETSTTAMESQRLSEIIKSGEKPTSPEVGEKQKPYQEPAPKSDATKVTNILPDEPAKVKGNIIDKRTGNEKTHQVNPAADETTKKADVEEQEFIEKVEQTHTIAPNVT